MSVEGQIQQLNDARKLVLSDSSYYPQIVQGILPIIGSDARVELRRWGADFLAETFSSPAIPVQQKESLSLVVLETLKAMLETPSEDSGVLKSAVQASASIYPLVFKWIINNPYDSPTWERMTAIKSRILRIWDSTVTGVRICCVRFAERVVLAQTSGADTDSKRGDGLAISLSMVPPNHPLIPPRNLEAEASGLLDRVLGVLQEQNGDAVLVDATLNSLSSLIRTRPHITNKILNAVLNFNPLRLANSPMTPKMRVMAKSMEKTTRLLMIHINKREPQNPQALRIHQYIERLVRSRTEIFDEASRKRGPSEPIDGLESSKRQRLGAELTSAPSSRLHIPRLTPGPHTIGELFTITTDESLKAFDVSQLSDDLVLKIGITILSRLNISTLNQAIEGIRERFETYNATQSSLAYLNPNTAPLGVEDDDDDYEPDFQTAEDTEQILNKLDNAPPEDRLINPPDVALGPFVMLPPKSLNKDEALDAGRNIVSRVFEVMQTLEEPINKKSKAGVNRLAASTYDREAWITVITRLATRASSGLETWPGSIKAEESQGHEDSYLSSSIRENLYLYVIEDFRRRIDTAVSWLCEEWYNDKMQAKNGAGGVLHYHRWTLRILDGMMPYLDARDKVLTRFLSEIPSLNPEILERVKGLCRDPAMVNLALTSLLYLVMMRPPVREIALDAVEDIWRTYEDAKPTAAKYLTKWRPGFGEGVEVGETHANQHQSNGQPGLAVAT